MVNILVYFTLSAAFIILSCFLFVYFFRKNNLRFEHVLPISLMSNALLLFLITVIFHNIQLSFILTVVAQLIALGVFIFFDKQRKLTIIQFFQSPAIVLFLLVLAGLYAVNFGRVLSSFDDFIHWGPFVTDTLRINDFYNSVANTAFSVHGDYPPVATMFEVFYLKLTANNEWLMFVASQLLCLAMFFPLFSKLSWAKGTRAKTLLNMAIVLGLIVAALLSVTLQANAAFFYEIRIDTLMACVGAYGIYVAFTEGKKLKLSTIIKLSVIITFMLLLKQIAVVLVLVIIFVYAGMLIIHRKDTMGRKKPKKITNKVKGLYVAVVIVAVIMPPAFLKLWSVQVEGCIKNVVCTEQFSSHDISFLKVPLVVTGHSGTQVQKDTAKHFLNYVYTGQTLISSDILKITYPQFILLFCGAMFGLLVYAHRKKQQIAGVVVTTVVLLGGYVVYLYVLLGSYLYAGFSEGEVSILASADRYIGTYILLMILVVMMLYITIWKNANESHMKLFISGAVIFLIFCLLLGPTAYKSALPYSFLSYSRIDTTEEFKRPIDEAINTIKSDKEFNDSSVIVLAECNNQPGLWESTYLRYHVRPNPYLVAGTGAYQEFVRNVDYKGSYQYVDPAGRQNDSKDDISVYVVAMCSGDELKKYNTEDAKLMYFDKVEGIKPKWQVFKTTAPGNYYNTLNKELNSFQTI